MRTHIAVLAHGADGAVEAHMQRMEERSEAMLEELKQIRAQLEKGQG